MTLAEPRSGTGVRHVLLIADSLCFHGDRRPELLTHPQIFPNVMAAELTRQHGPTRVDIVTRMGWTARDAWWALTKDPVTYGLLLPRADAVVLAVGSMDQLPASLPTYLREGLSYVRPGTVRRPLRRAYHRVHPWVVRATRARLRTLPQAATDHYLSRCVGAVRHFHPGVPVVGITPPRHVSAYYGGMHPGHPAARAAARVWAEREGVPAVELEPLVAPEREAGRNNPDGMHWGFGCHAAVGAALAAAVGAQWAAPRAGSA